MITTDEAVKRVARALCLSDGENPDRLVSSGAPYMVYRGYAVMGEQEPLWTHYALLARAAIDAVEQLPPDYLEMLAS